MKVSELIEALQKMPQDAAVVAFDAMVDSGITGWGEIQHTNYLDALIHYNRDGAEVTAPAVAVASEIDL